MPTTTSSPLRTFLRAPRKPDYGLIVGFGVLALLITTDILTGVALAASYASAAVVSALITTPQRSAILAAATIAASCLSGLWHDTVGTRDWAVRVALSIALTMLAVIAAEVSYRRERRLRKMTAIAETAQRAVLRATPKSLGGLGLATRYQSATVEAAIGGDLYEAISTPYGIRVIVGDVRGKGFEAVETAATVLGAFRQTALTAPDLTDLACTIDAVVSKVVGDEDFVTAVLAEIDGDLVRVANCGHHPPLLVTAAGAATELDTGEPSPPLGLFTSPEVTAHPFPSGARLLLYTDGLIEARNRARDFFPLHEHSTHLAEGTPDDALDRLVATLRDHCGARLGDDLALMLVENTPDCPAQPRFSRPA